MVGSSPRGRGTLGVAVVPAADERFIPAWAGNAARRPCGRRRAPVHPRVGGERPAALCDALGVPGSSPRGRGTPRSSSSNTLIHRFIPAWAGNARPIRLPTRTQCGSSPRGRGTLSGWHRDPINATVHPRVGGERHSLEHHALQHYGSSPRGRGTRVDQARGQGRRRFIPAWAGNATKAPCLDLTHLYHLF